MKIFLWITSLISIFTISSLFGQEDSLKQIPGKFEKEVTVKVSLKYLLYLPEGYDQDNKTFPLVLFLHGSGERGDDLRSAARHGPPMLVEQGRNFPFLLVSPQCPLGERWNPLELSVSA